MDPVSKPKPKPMLRAMSVLSANVSSDLRGGEEEEEENETPIRRRLGCIMENPGDSSPPTTDKFGKPLTEAQKKRANMVKKCIKYFGDKNNRSTSEDNLLTRRKNLAVHLGLDETVEKSVVQKINRRCLPVPSAPLEEEEEEDEDEEFIPILERLRVVESEAVRSAPPTMSNEDVKSKNLVQYLGIADGMSLASISAQGTLSEGMTSDNPNIRTHQAK